MDSGFDIGSAIEQLKGMMGSEDGQDRIRNIVNMFSSGEDTSYDNDQSDYDEPPPSNGDGPDPETLAMMMKLTKAMGAMNNHKNSPGAELLRTLRPFLRSQRRNKVDEAVKLLSLTSVLDILKEVN